MSALQCFKFGQEHEIIRLFKVGMASRHVFEDRIPLNTAGDKIFYEHFPFLGRAAIVVDHSDGTTSVLEVKDGTRGFPYVYGGIGFAEQYARRIQLLRGTRTIRPCLLWTATDNRVANALIEFACETAGVVPLPWGRLADHLAAEVEVLKQARIKTRLGA